MVPPQGPSYRFGEAVVGERCGGSAVSRLRAAELVFPREQVRGGHAAARQSGVRLNPDPATCPFGPKVGGVVPAPGLSFGPQEAMANDAPRRWAARSGMAGWDNPWVNGLACRGMSRGQA